ncbi:MAG: SDR family NAD(P)-dependent oxidoreductase [Actinomycetota bacterium]
MKLAGRVCVVTGASSGIGRGAAGTFAANGARVCLVARRKPRLEQVLAEIGGEGAGHSLFVCDVSQRDQVVALADFVRSTYDRCDVLVNNAGYSTDGTFEGPADIDRFEQVMAVNFYGTLYCTGELLPLLSESAPSSIVNVASVAGRLGMGGNPSYCASKFAMVGFSESLYTDAARRGVCVSIIEPGFIPTEGFPQSRFVAKPMMKHALGTVEDVAEAILDAVVNRKMERVVPRWYYLLQFPRLLAPPLYRWAGKKLAR